MTTTIIIGAQWGDEGKGKIIDFLSQKAHAVVRFHGGNNAGHTVINKYGTFPLHLIPSGIFSKKALACISSGTVIDLETLTKEITLLEKAGIQIKNKLYISPRCHVIFPYHKLLDALFEKIKSDNKTGTTGRGIGPVHADKVSYNGIRLIDFFDKKIFSEKLAAQLKIKNTILQAFKEKPLVQKEIEDNLFSLFARIKPCIHEPFTLLQHMRAKKKSIVFEGAQGTFLDNDWGTYPFVTASNTISSAIGIGAGMYITSDTKIIGITKAYATRVGAGPFPTELSNATGELLRKNGNEFGATTGRARRTGWFDAELLRFAATINGLTHIAITKLDILDTFTEINVCIGYMYKGKKVHYTDLSAEQLFFVKPIYKTYKGWMQSTRGITKFANLPIRAQKYIQTLEKLIGVPVALISTGPKRNETIVV